MGSLDDRLNRRIALRRRLDLRRSNAAVPHRNHHRERKSGQQPPEPFELLAIRCLDCETTLTDDTAVYPFARPDHDIPLCQDCADTRWDR